MIIPTKAGGAPRCAGRKRLHALTLAVYDPAAAEQRANAASLSLSGALVPFLAPPVDAAPINPNINAVPLSAVAPRAEPAWIRAHFDLRLDLTVTFIDEKAVTATDLDPQQNRFRLPTAGVLRSLRPILSLDELDAARIPREDAKPPRLPPTEEELQQRKKKQGKKHGGLPVVVCNVHAATKQLQLTRWESSHGNIIKGEGYMDFITRCCFKENDIVEIWAFKERYFCLFGVDMCHASPLCVVLTKKEQHPAASIEMVKCTM
ncbi:hypothetical protein CFC21_030858 [Triticum aestivum]|uniref:TF-B3 domain-containing protein n=2 Tax=Triticum aestivum TaxID=4565 RepID=A0A9R1EW71_WHEAT|nr:hypothetical protein CFC21_030858 [Triticum aestivum]